jgi:thioredoxin-like negative regulator of GroEL
MALRDWWNKVAGKDEPERIPADEPGRNQQRFEQGLQRELSEMQQRQMGTHPDQVAAREEMAQKAIADQQREAAARSQAASLAKDLQKPGPAERMVSYKDLFTEPTRVPLKEARETAAVEKQEIADGKRPPIKSYSELHPEQSKTPQR